MKDERIKEEEKRQQERKKERKKSKRNRGKHEKTGEITHSALNGRLQTTPLTLFIFGFWFCVFLLFVSSFFFLLASCLGFLLFSVAGVPTDAAEQAHTAVLLALRKPHDHGAKHAAHAAVLVGGHLQVGGRQAGMALI
mgnify:CR=1 FL=1